MPRWQGQSVLSARLESRSRHRPCHICGRRTDQFADPCARPGLHRSQLAHSGNRQRAGTPQGSVFRRRGRLRQCRRPAHLVCATAVDKNIEQVTVGSFGYDRYLAWVRPSSAAALCSMLANSMPIMVRGPIPTTCGKFTGLAALQPGHRDRRLLGDRRWPMPILEFAPIRWRCGPLPRDRSGLYGAARSDRRRRHQPLLAVRHGWRKPIDNGSWKTNAYFVKYSAEPIQQLHLVRPLNHSISASTGDQFHQHDERVYGGGGASRTFNGTLFSLPTETAVRRANAATTISATRAEPHVPAPVAVQRTLRSCQGGQCRHLRREHGALDRLAAEPPPAGAATPYAASVNSTLQPANSGR